MNNYLVSFCKNGELFESIVTAKTADEARETTAIRFKIPIKFEVGSQYMNEDNYVSAVIKI